MAKNDKHSRAPSKSAGQRASQPLSDDERALWEHAARNLQPLKSKKHRVTEARSEPATARHATEKPRPQPLIARPPQHGAPPPKPPAPPPLSDLDRRKARRVGSGKIEIEARIDLHGMRQSEAHAALRRFLHGAYANGKRWVLVITGKGAPMQRGWEARTQEEGYGAASERGVLRRNVPRWLEEPELRSIVVGFTTAAVRHGGEGALYVQLRKRGQPDAAQR